MATNRCPELVEVIPSVGARIALQNYFFNNDLSKRTNAPSELSLASTSTPSVTPTLTLALPPREIFDTCMTLDKEVPISNDTEISTENAMQTSFVESPSVNDTQNIVIINTTCEDEVAKKIRRIETADNMVCKIVHKCLKYVCNFTNTIL